uniref:Endothelin-converting enzyme 1 n=1 Tax=Caenorhabditis japonica TaxID=281687 RepID=A0A8R1DX97_CAEJA
MRVNNNQQFHCVSTYRIISRRSLPLQKCRTRTRGRLEKVGEEKSTLSQLAHHLPHHSTILGPLCAAYFGPPCVLCALIITCKIVKLGAVDASDDIKIVSVEEKIIQNSNSSSGATVISDCSSSDVTHLEHFPDRTRNPIPVRFAPIMAEVKVVTGKRNARLAAVFAALFILTLLISISFITIVAILSDGFSTLISGGAELCAGNTEEAGGSKHAPSHPYFGRNFGGENATCLTPDCIRLAANYLNNMNRDANPCEDFYEFACGKYASRRVIAEHEKKVTVLSEMKKELDRHLRDILEKSSRDNATRSMKLAQIYFDSCMDEFAQDDLGVQPLMSLISNLGGWPLLTNARFDSIDFQWEVLAGHLALYGVDGIFRVFVHSSFDDSHKHALMFSPPKLFLEKKKFYREVPSSNVYLQYYRQYILSILSLLGVDMEDESGVIEYQVDDIIDFERRIANLTRIELSRNHSSINNMMTFGEFKKKYEKINWEAYFNEEMRSNLGRMPDSLLINVVDVNYFDNLYSLIKSKPLSSINNFLMWCLVSNYDFYLPAKYRKPKMEFKRKMYGIGSDDPLWEICVGEVRDNLAMPLSTEYAHKFFTKREKGIAEDMIRDLKKAMEQTLLNADWIDESTREAALMKLDAMGHKIGFPDSLLNETAVLLPYAGVRLTANQFFDNAISLKKAAYRDALSKLHRAPSVIDWASPIIAVDAFHYFTGNEIIFPAGILQFPMFVPDAPSFANYGAIGMGIGHEITHGYDDLGAQYDDKGNLRGWWHTETMTTFQKKKQCFVAQYGSRVEPHTGRKVDGKMTIGENIADNGGLRVAFRAYQLKLEREKEARRLPGLTDFSPNQLFFLAYANTWCEALKPSAIDHIMDTDVHSLGMFRVNVPLQNLPAFSKEFDCPIGSPMNPFEKCRIW